MMFTYLVLLGLTVPAAALEKSDLEQRIFSMTAKFEAMQQNPDKRVPPDTLNRAKGILLLDRTKAGFLFAYQGGGGVAMVKDAKTGKWGPVAFMSAGEASLGFQIGGQQSFFVVLFMTTNVVPVLTDASFQLGGETRATAGPDSAGVSGTTHTDKGSILVYDDHKGLYAGADVQAGGISTDDDANKVYYGKSMTVKEILTQRNAEVTAAAKKLADKLAEYSKPPPKE